MRPTLCLLLTLLALLQLVQVSPPARPTPPRQACLPTPGAQPIYGRKRRAVDWQPGPAPRQTRPVPSVNELPLTDD